MTKIRKVFRIPMILIIRISFSNGRNTRKRVTNVYTQISVYIWYVINWIAIPRSLKRKQIPNSRKQKHPRALKRSLKNIKKWVQIHISNVWSGQRHLQFFYLVNIYLGHWNSISNMGLRCASARDYMVLHRTSLSPLLNLIKCKI